MEHGKILPGMPRDHRSHILNALRGQTLKIPDLVEIVYPDWSVSRHPEESKLREELEGSFAPRWCSNAAKRDKLQKGDFAQIAGYVWPDVPLERVRPLAQFIYWYFTWDDEIDYGELRYDEAGTETYRKDTIAILEWTLEPENYRPERVPRPVTRGNHNTDCFEEIGKALQIGQSMEALKRYAQSMYKFVNAVCTAQKQRVEGFPSWEDYIANREHTIGVYPCLTAMEYAYSLFVLKWVYQHDATHTMFKETATSCIIANDIISLKKEVADNQIDSVIPLKMWHGNHTDAQLALDEIITELRDSKKRFDIAAACLTDSKQYRDLDSRTQKDIATLVQSCKNTMLGNLKWSLSNERYMSGEQLDGWAVVIHL